MNDDNSTMLLFFVLLLRFLLIYFVIAVECVANAVCVEGREIKHKTLHLLECGKLRVVFTSR